MNENINTEGRSIDFFDSSREAIVFIDGLDRTLMDANHTMVELSGIKKRELIGKAIGQIEFFQPLAENKNVLDEILDRGFVEQVYFTTSTADNDEVKLRLKGESFSSNGKTIIRCSISQNVSELNRVENLTAEVQKKETMLHELQHRTKNTFAMIAGLVELKSITSTSRESTEMLDELAMRVQSISELYRLLYENDTEAQVNMATYCHVISKSIVGISDEIHLESNVEDVFIGTKYATSLGLIQVELLYNIMKYAFPDNRPEKMVKIGLVSAPNDTTLKVSDNGVGLPADFEANGTGSSGLGLVQLLANQLSGSVQISSGTQGTEVTVEIPSNQSGYA